MPPTTNKSRFRHRWFNRRAIVRNLEVVQDLIVVCLGVSLLFEMIILLWAIFSSLLEPFNFQAITSDILFLLILVELFRLLINFLEDRRISVGVAVEVAIVSVLREIIVHGVLEIDWSQVLAICAFLLVLGALLLICTQTPYACELKNGDDLSKSSTTADDAKSKVGF
ncbi:MAG: phosphate-starvation-inducible PsiE family protein [Oscillatoria sp. PMC 1051.18]|nr:phosphate-starvation-inducible PsiE family protein [Oscillatoria sp. PMC 1050.18]MEC5028873.1 phosphate-starvation-inducible PsiE family protein [Oscillatoria sp. PMC 1051.18]